MHRFWPPTLRPRMLAGAIEARPRDGTLAHERDGHWLGADAAAPDATGGDVPGAGAPRPEALTTRCRASSFAGQDGCSNVRPWLYPDLARPVSCRAAYSYISHRLSLPEGLWIVATPVAPRVVAAGSRLC